MRPGRQRRTRPAIPLRHTAGIEFDLWLETEHLVGGADDYCNVLVTLQSGEEYALNVWSYAFFHQAVLDRDPSMSPDPTGRYMLPPDLFVVDLSRATVEAVIADLLEQDRMPANCLVPAEDASPSAPAVQEVVAPPPTEMTVNASSVLGSAARRADAWNHHWVGGEHLLLGYLEAERDGLAPPDLTAAGISLEAAEEAVAAAVPAFATREVDWDGALFTARLTRICALAEGWALARVWPDPAKAGTEDLLLALLCERRGVAFGVLSDLGLDVGALALVVGTRVRDR